MPRYRMIAIDLDGTLLSPQGEVTPRSKTAVHKALSAGYLVCFATGRHLTESRTIIDAVEHYGTAVFVGGAMVIDTGNNVMLHRSLLDPLLARELCQAIEAEGHAVLALQDSATTALEYLVSTETPMDPATAQWMRVTAATIHRFPRLGTHPHDRTVRVGMVAATGEARRVRQALLDRFGERILCHNLHVSGFDVEVLEVFDPGVNKWEGIQFVARRHGIAPQEIIAIGDDMNDVPMLLNAGLGVAMGNARPEAMAAAKKVIKPNTEEGLAEFLEELVDQHLVEPV